MTTSTVSPLLVQYLKEKPLDRAADHACKAKLYCAAMVASAIASLVIFGGLSAMYLGLLGPIALSCSATLASIGLSVVLLSSVNVFSKWHIQEKKQVRRYQKLDAECKTIQHWDEKKIRQFFTSHHRSVRAIPPKVHSVLQQIDRKSPLKALLPLIARHELMQKTVEKWRQKEKTQNEAIAKLNALPAIYKGPLSKIHQMLAERAKQKQTHYRNLGVESLQLIWS